ncbi:MAG: GGDEF domain-containing protein, partial [Rectinemataceae bacterium]|nr:GGDEF domain-containing protein [Rectinemataceae bacterium]
NNLFILLNSAPFIVSCYFEALALLKLSDALDSDMKKTYRSILIVGLFAYFFSVFIIGAIHVRILIFTAINSLLLVPAALRSIRLKNRSSLHKLLAVLFILMMSAFSIRVLDTLRLGPSLALFGPTFGEIAMIVFLYIYLLLGGVGITLLAKEKTDANLLHLAHYDESTGALNRDGFIDAAIMAIGTASKSNEAFSAILVDIDGFNEISETQGYVAGDCVIMNTVKRLREAVGAAGFVGRLNEYEFMLFLKGVDRRHVGDVAATIHKAIAKYANGGVAYSVSIGAVAFEGPSLLRHHFPLIHAACAQALDSAKKKGRGEMVITTA